MSDSESSASESSYDSESSGKHCRDHAISKLCFKGIILQRNYRKMPISWSFFYNTFVRFYGKKIWKP